MADATTPTPAAATPPAAAPAGLITLRSFLAGLLFAGVFALVTVCGENVPPQTTFTATQIPVLPYVLLFGCVLVFNPLLRLLQLAWRGVTGRLPHWCRPLAPAETLTVFVMGLVSSGISTFGLASQVIPLMSGLMNRQMNTEQNQWDLYVEPYVNERFFLAEAGLRTAATAFRDADRQWREARQTLDAARSLKATAAEVAAAEATVATATAANDLLALASAQRQARQVKLRLAPAQAAWQRVAAHAGGATPDVVVATFPAKAAAAEAARTAAQEALNGIKERSFAVVEEFRRGLPAGARAVPGIIYLPSDTAAGYLARCHRLYSGTKARREVERAVTLLARDAAAPPPAAAEHLERAAALLEPLTTLPAMDERNATLTAELATLAEQQVAREALLKLLNQRRRAAEALDFARLDEQIRAEEKAKNQIGVEIAARKQAQDTLKPHFELLKQVVATRDALRTLAGQLRGQPDLAAAREQLGKQLAAFHAFDASYRRFLIGDIPWRHWLGPLLNWAVLILLTYLVLMAFNALIFRQWAHNEKLVYPLAELPEALAGAGGSEHWVPEVFRRGLFWAGFAVAAGMLGWNLMVIRGWLPGLSVIAIIDPRWSSGISWASYVADTKFQALGAGKIHIFFAILGLAFLIPASISGSLTLFHLLFLGELLLLVWLGYGDNIKSFPADWSLILNFKTAQGGGALLIFAAVIFWKCRQYLFCAFQPRLVQHLAADDRQDLRTNSALFLGGSAALVATLSWGLGVNVFYAMLYYLVILVITIGLIRAVTEGGVLGFQCWFGPLHLGRTVVGMDKSWTAPSFFAPIMVYHAILFLDIKTFIAPAMANALKVRDDLKLPRLRFHLALWGAILAAMLVAAAAHIILGYYRTGDQMHSWFYGGLPQTVFGGIRQIAKDNPVDTAGGLGWLISGMAVMSLLLYLRRHVFWLPHPIGLIMLVNPLLGTYWFSFFLGWLAKTMVTKYGNKHTYHDLRFFFIGLIVGELVMCLFGHSLNRSF